MRLKNIGTTPSLYSRAVAEPASPCKGHNVLSNGDCKTEVVSPTRSKALLIFPEDINELITESPYTYPEQAKGISKAIQDFGRCSFSCRIFAVAGAI